MAGEERDVLEVRAVLRHEYVERRVGQHLLAVESDDQTLGAIDGGLDSRRVGSTSLHGQQRERQARVSDEPLGHVRFGAEQA